MIFAIYIEYDLMKLSFCIRSIVKLNIEPDTHKIHTQLYTLYNYTYTKYINLEI